jgi:hypothetical protein
MSQTATSAIDQQRELIDLLHSKIRAAMDADDLPNNIEMYTHMIDRAVNTFVQMKLHEQAVFSSD